MRWLARAIEDLARLERLPQRIEHLRLEFRQLIEKQHAIMRKRCLSGPRIDAAAHQRRHGGGMMRRAKRPAARERAIGQQARDRLDHGDFQKLARGERRQNRREPLRQHRLAGAGRAAHQKIMGAGGRDLERSLGALLSLDVAQIRLRT